MHAFISRSFRNIWFYPSWQKIGTGRKKDFTAHLITQNDGEFLSTHALNPSLPFIDIAITECSKDKEWCQHFFSFRLTIRSLAWKPSYFLIPTDPFTILESWNPLIDFAVRHKFSRTFHLEALELWKCQSGCSSFSTIVMKVWVDGWLSQSGGRDQTCANTHTPSSGFSNHVHKFSQLQSMQWS